VLFNATGSCRQYALDAIANITGASIASDDATCACILQNCLG
jgi:hypothetical protein